MNMKKIAVIRCWLALCFAAAIASASNADYASHPDAIRVVQELVEEEGLDAAQLTAILAQAEKRQSIIDAMNRPAEKTFTWGRYRNIFLKEPRIESGAEFWAENVEVLQKAEVEFGVPAEVIVAIIGVETLYGGNTGSYPVIDALSTLAFDYPKRSPFFRSELKHFLILTAEQGQDPLDFKGSYAGAMGLGQFMPSSYRAYAKGYEDDGFIDIWSDKSDAIWSVANYLKVHGWKPGEKIAQIVEDGVQIPAEIVSTELKPTLSISELSAAGIDLDVGVLPEGLATLMVLEAEDGLEHWIGWQNFYVITRYNHSELYAMAVFQLAQAIRESYSQRTIPE